MLFSKACEYAIRAVVRITQATASDQRISVKTIAAEIGTPEAFTAKILQQLVREGLIGSMKGPGGGFVLTPARAGKLKLSAIVDAIDGDEVYTGCALGLPQCSNDQPCALHEHFMGVRRDLRRVLEETTILQIAERTKE